MQLIYKSVALYGLVDRLLYGRHRAARYAAIADLIPPRSSVVDLCCGPAALYHRELRQKAVAYTGLDLSPVFIASLNKRGGRGLLWDLHSETPLPRADYILIQGSLCYFLPNPKPLIDRMLAAATHQIIISESIRNLSSSKNRLISKVAMRLAGAVKGDHPPRFDEEMLDNLFSNYPVEVTRSFKNPGGRDKVYVLQGSPRCPSRVA